MNQKQTEVPDALLASVRATFEAGLAIVARKNHDYGSLADPFCNFRAAQQLGISVEKGILVRVLDKIARVNNLLDHAAFVTEESMEDTLTDAINYLALLKAYREITAKPPAPAVVLQLEPPKALAPATAARVPAVKRSPGRPANVEAKPAAIAAPNGDATPAKVIALLAKKPMTSGEVIAALPGVPAQLIYCALSNFRKAGRVVMIEDPETVQKKNKLTEPPCIHR